MQRSDPQVVFTKDYIEKMIPHYNKALEDRLPKIKQNLEKIIKPSTEWLDVGCCTAIPFGWFEHATRTGIDISSDAIMMAKDKHPDCSFVNVSLEVFSKNTKNKYDLITVLGHPYFYAADITKFCKSLTTLLKPDGVLYIEVLKPNVSKENSNNDTQQINNNLYILKNPFATLKGLAPDLLFFRGFFDAFFQTGHINRSTAREHFVMSGFKPAAAANPNNPEKKSKTSAAKKRNIKKPKRLTPDEMMERAERRKPLEDRIRKRVKENRNRKWKTPPS